MDTAEHDDRNVKRILRDTFNPQSEHSPQGSNQAELVRTSRLAVIAGALAVLSLLLLPGLIGVSRRGLPPLLQSVYVWFLAGTSLTAGLLGILSLVRIAVSAGRLTGKGFACAGVLAPAAQILLFFLVLLPALPRSRAFRMTCGTHLSGIGKAMMIYANDYEDEFPRAGGPSSQWTGRIADWTASRRHDAYGLSSDGSGGQVSMSASLYLLVKYAEVAPKSFLCGAGSRKTREKGVTEFKLGMYRVADPKPELIDFWDFGPNPPKHCSYSYHMLYGPSSVTVSSSSNFAIAGDRNPWMDSPSVKARDFSKFVPDIAPCNGTSEQALLGNAVAHKRDGQSVLFLDSHVEFEKRPFCGLDDDNIYTSWDGADKSRGVPPKLGSVPADARDSLLVNDPVTVSK